MENTKDLYNEKLEKVIALLEKEIEELEKFMKKQELKFEKAKTDKERAFLNEVITETDGKITGIGYALSVVKLNK